ncbi:MAG: hypothetical protein KKD47_08395 [Proteobacteria bacterium]|nr:hypothetical protein [Pseudomonadota bacterium]
MKMIIAILSAAILASALSACAGDEVKLQLRPSQIMMQARKAWMMAMFENLGAKNFIAVARDADELAAQTRKAGEKSLNPLGKELTLAISSLAGDISAAAARQDGDTAKAKLGEIGGKCGECHASIRDKK